MEKRLGFVGIIIEDRKKNAPKVNEILSLYSEIISARMGLPAGKQAHYREKDFSIITLIIEATTDEIGALTGKLGKIQGVSVKSSLSKA
jgi:putative iron-only hydrogenase system regulator